MKLTNHSSDLEYNDFDNVSDDLISTFVHRVLIVVYSIEGEILKAKEANQSYRVKQLKTLMTKKKEIYSQVFSILSYSAQHVFSAATESLSVAISEAEARSLDDENEKTKVTRELSEFHASLYAIAKDHNKFLDFIHIYIACLASERHTRYITSQLNNTCKKAIELLSTLTKYCDIKSDKIELKEKDNILKHDLSNDFIKFLAWSLSKIAHSLIKIFKTDKEDDQDQTYQTLLKSRLFSGGLDIRFLSMFSSDSRQAIDNLAQITEDKTLIPFLTEVEKNDEDELYEAIIHKGKNQFVDRLIDLFQWSLTKKPGIVGMKAKVGGEEGMTITRCAFAAIICLNQSDENINYTDICVMIDLIEMTLETEDSEDENKLNKVLWNELEDISGFKACYERWEIASQMRSWLSEKVKDISLSLVEKAKENSLKDPTKISQEESKESNNDKEKIDTTHPEMSEVDENEIREQEKLARQSLVDKVVKKAELLTKLSIPSSWDISDTSSQTIMSNIEDEFCNPIIRAGESMTDQLKRFKIIRESKGIVTNYGKLSTDEIFKS